jgi:hypothetical protein
MYFQRHVVTVIGAIHETDSEEVRYDEDDWS